MKDNFHISGIHIGEHRFNIPEVLNEIEERRVKETSFLTIRTRRELVPPEYFYEWAKWCRDNKVYFMYLYTVQHAPYGHESQFTPEIVAKIKEIAGEYFLGDQIGEVGTKYGACPQGYRTYMPSLDDMQECRDYFMSEFKKTIAIDEKLGMPNVVPVEATAIIKYTYDAGCPVVLLEMLPGDPEFLVSLTRGCAHSYGNELWGTYIAHEWYGGIRNDDWLKRQRLKVAYNYTYLTGSHIICLESGDEMVTSYGSKYKQGDVICDEYMNTVLDYEKFIRANKRIAPEPERKVALVYGNLDAYTGFMGQTIWEQHDKKEWSQGDAEWSWNITKDLHHGRSWQDVENYGDEDLSFAPAYGLYDVIPANAPADKMKKYDTIIFVGWNTMTDEILANLKEFVKDGGYLFMTGAHFNTNTKRDGKFIPIADGKLADFIGFDFGEVSDLNLGLKFCSESYKDGVLFPNVPGGFADPILAAGTFRKIDAKLTTAREVAYWHNSIYSRDADPNNPRLEGREWNNEYHPAFMENKYGDGVVAVLATADYPGSNAVYPSYRAIVRELFTASHRNCDIKVISTDKLRFSVFRGETEDMICLLNTDFTNDTTLTIKAHGKEITKTLKPCELAIEKIER